MSRLLLPFRNNCGPIHAIFNGFWYTRPHHVVLVPSNLPCHVVGSIGDNFPIIHILLFGSCSSSVLGSYSPPVNFSSLPVLGIADRRVSVERHIKTLGIDPPRHHHHPAEMYVCCQAHLLPCRAGSVTKSFTLHQLLKHLQKFFGDICVLRRRRGRSCSLECKGANKS